ncbi:hypothetical protein [Streptomyces sp. NBC_01422]|uniref:hypothetical protein n=1 Tax=Streptomyces sp. NBC_01422 TaxID=2903859 RepID=UPI002E2A1077|nr:hypothetical protein [Streptomyces sp. NBC_01422]
MTDIGVTLAQLQKRIDRLERASRLSSASLDDTALEVRDSGGSLRGILGQQGDGTTAVNIVNGGPPPAPATPSAAPALGGVSVGWDGAFADGAIIPLDWARIEVHASPTAAFTPTADTLKATIETAQGSIVYIPTAVPLYVQLLARNTSGAASPATTEVGPYAPKPVAGEIGIGEITETLIADGSVTTPKVYANAITTALLAAGSVDATALKADAITGKTITGGVINGAEFHSDDGAGGLVDIQNGTIVATASSGWKVSVLPNNTLPAIAFNDSTGQPAGSVVGSGSDALPNLGLLSGVFTDPVVGNSRWLTTLGATASGNRVWTRRVHPTTLNQVAGGEAMIDDDGSRIAYIDPANATFDTFLTLYANLASLYNARLVIAPPATASPVLHLNAATGQTGALLRLQLNGVDKFSVSPDGSVTTADITVTGRVIKDASWSTLSTGTGWSGFGGTFGSGRYRRMPDGSVVLRDLINRTASTTLTSGEVVGTLPAGYRPVTIAQQNVWVGGSTGGVLSVNINATGTITLTNLSPGAVSYLSTGNGYLSLNGLRYFLD